MSVDEQHTDILGARARHPIRMGQSPPSTTGNAPPSRQVRTASATEPIIAPSAPGAMMPLTGSRSGDASTRATSPPSVVATPAASKASRSPAARKAEGARATPVDVPDELKGTPRSWTVTTAIVDSASQALAEGRARRRVPRRSGRGALPPRLQGGSA
jgi:hypothetical protein